MAWKLVLVQSAMREGFWCWWWVPALLQPSVWLEQVASFSGSKAVNLEPYCAAPSRLLNPKFGEHTRRICEAWLPHGRHSLAQGRLPRWNHQPWRAPVQSQLWGNDQNGARCARFELPAFLFCVSEGWDLECGKRIDQQPDSCFPERSSYP